MISEDGKSLINSTTYNFAEFKLEAANLLLLKDSKIVPLAPKTIEVLLALIESSGNLVTKQEILEKVWTDTFVEEANLTHHISALRKALGEDKNGRKFIETIPRRGYRFVAEVSRAPNSETAEIVISERAAVRSLEETMVETADDDLPHGVLPSRRKSWKFIGLFAAMILLVGAAAFFAYRNYNSAKNSVAPPEISFKRLTPDADASAPSVSPDGGSVVFVKNENGQRSLWRKQIASGELTQLTPAVAIKDVEIASTRFSPDGRWIYFTKNIFDAIEKTLTIYRIPALGGAEQKVLAGLDLRTDFSISPDGRRIAYSFDWRQIIVADIETGNKQIILDWDGVKRWVRGGFSTIAWSPDGLRLMFAGGETNNNNHTFQLYEINLSTNELKQIPLPEHFGIYQIEWLKDDSGLIVTRQNYLGQYEIWFIDYHSGETRRISKENDDFGDLRISADGKTIIADQRIGQFHIWTAPADNIDKRRQITIGAAALHGAGGLALMPDGRILYTSTESGQSDIWIMNGDGGERRQLTVNAENNFSPNPTKDGLYIIFTSMRSGTNQVWRMDADGKNPVQLSNVSESYSFSVAPEGDVYYITFLSDEQKYQIYKVAITGGEPVKINDFYTTWQPQFSPDGRWILIFGGKTKDEKSRTCIIERASGKIVRYFDNNFAPRGWMPDSKAIVDSMSQTQQLWRQPIDGSAAEKIYDLSPLKIARWDFSADGKQVVFSLGNATSEIVAIQNFSENIK